MFLFTSIPRPTGCPLKLALLPDSYFFSLTLVVVVDDGGWMVYEAK